MVRAGSGGLCLGNKVIKPSIVKGECPEEKVIMGPDGINLTLELGKHPQPRFHIKFTGQLSYMFSARNAFTKPLLRLMADKPHNAALAYCDTLKPAKILF